MVSEESSIRTDPALNSRTRRDDALISLISFTRDQPFQALGLERWWSFDLNVQPHVIQCVPMVLEVYVPICASWIDHMPSYHTTTSTIWNHLNLE